MVDEDLNLRRFMSLFRGNNRSYGVWDPKKAKGKDSRTEHGAYADEHFKAHFRGELGLGLVPIRDDGSTFWGAIDVDNHGKDQDTDIRALERTVRAKGYPLVPCRSKSGGVHLYIFFSEPVRADQVRTVLQRWAKTLEVEGVDCIYPRQGKLTRNSEGQQAYGNWINLPYFDPDGANARWAIQNGKQLSLDSFLSMAESEALEASALTKFFQDDLSEMPPCLQARLQAGGFSSGERNTGVYQVAVFCRKRDPEGARDAAHDLSQRFMVDDPLPFKERDKTIRSATLSKSSNYKCPDFKDVCDREACRKLKWGISESEYDAMRARAGMPSFGGLVKYWNADPIRFDVMIGEEGNERRIEGLGIEELSNFAELRKAVMARTHIVLPRLKNDEWDGILRDLFASVRIEEIPEEATPEGAVKSRLIEFLHKADLKSEGDDATKREALLRGVPVVQILDDVKVVMFRSNDFIAYLQKMKTDVVKAKDLWFKVSEKMGVGSTRLRVNKVAMGVWYLPVNQVEEEEHHAAHFKPEY